MKSTLKIDYDRGQANLPVIKIIVPIDETVITVNNNQTPGYNEPADEDIRDKLIRDLLHSPCMAEPNSLFQVKTSFPVNGGRLTTIGAIQEQDVFNCFRYAILNRLVPYETILAINRKEISVSKDDVISGSHVDKYLTINAFFDWVEQTGYCTYEERQPK